MLSYRLTNVILTRNSNKPYSNTTRMQQIFVFPTAMLSALRKAFTMEACQYDGA